jgi:hypothetical protein
MDLRIGSTKTYSGTAVAGFAAGLATVVASYVVLFIEGLIPSHSLWRSSATEDTDASFGDCAAPPSHPGTARST